jgi:hypothetical protein
VGDWIMPRRGGRPANYTPPGGRDPGWLDQFETLLRDSVAYYTQPTGLSREDRVTGAASPAMFEAGDAILETMMRKWWPSRVGPAADSGNLFIRAEQGLNRTPFEPGTKAAMRNMGASEGLLAAGSRSSTLFNPFLWLMTPSLMKMFRDASGPAPKS